MQSRGHPPNKVAPHGLMNHKVGVGGTLIGSGIAIGCAIAEPCGAGVTITSIVIAGGSAIYDFATH